MHVAPAPTTFTRAPATRATEAASHMPESEFLGSIVSAHCAPSRSTIEVEKSEDLRSPPSSGAVKTSVTAAPPHS